MRSRYSAFALGLASYVIDTTHPEGTSAEPDRAAWERSILEFARATDFVGLEVMDSSAGEAEGEVTFRARLTQGARDVSFTERSRFLLESGRWSYHSGVVEL